MPRVEMRTGLVRRTGPRALRFAARAPPLATTRLPQHELHGLGASPLRAGRGWLSDLHPLWIVTEPYSVNRFRRYFCEPVLQASSMNPAGLERARGGVIGAVVDRDPGLVDGCDQHGTRQTDASNLLREINTWPVTCDSVGPAGAGRSSQPGCSSPRRLPEIWNEGISEGIPPRGAREEHAPPPTPSRSRGTRCPMCSVTDRDSLPKVTRLVSSLPNQSINLKGRARSRVRPVGLVNCAAIQASASERQTHRHVTRSARPPLEGAAEGRRGRPTVATPE